MHNTELKEPQNLVAFKISNLIKINKNWGKESEILGGG